MGRKHFTEEQIAIALRQHDGGTAVAEIIRKLGTSEQTFYSWKKKYAGPGVEDLRRQIGRWLGFRGIDNTICEQFHAVIHRDQARASPRTNTAQSQPTGIIHSPYLAIRAACAINYHLSGTALAGVLPAGSFNRRLSESIAF